MTATQPVALVSRCSGSPFGHTLHTLDSKPTARFRVSSSRKISSQLNTPPPTRVEQQQGRCCQLSEDTTGSPSPAASPATTPAAAADSSTQYYTERITCPSGFSFECTPVNQFLDRPRDRYCVQETSQSGFTHTYTPPDQFPRRLIGIHRTTERRFQAAETAPVITGTPQGTGPYSVHFPGSGNTYTYSTPGRQEPTYVYSDERPYSPPARQGRPQVASTFAAPTHRAQVQAATEPGSITSVLERYLESSRKLVEQHRTQTRALLRQLEQQEAEIRLLQDEREALFHFRPLGKRKREDENQQADSDLPINFFGERPDLSPYLRLPEHQYLREPKVQDTWRITDQHGPIVYDSGIAVNVENNLERYVLPRQFHRTRPNLYLLECTSLVPTPDDSPSQDYFVDTPGGPIRVFGYGLAQATVPYPNGRWGLVAYWAYYAPQAETSYRTRYGLLGSSVRHIDQYGNQHPPDRGTASGQQCSAA